MKKIDLNNVEEAQEFEKVVPGGYVCGITAVEDVADREYLKLEYDIADGKLKNYYRNLYNSHGFWGASFIKSYKDKALPFFKKFVTAVEQSNKGYKWDNDETSLKRKLVGLVLGEEEYINKDGEVKTRLYVSDVVSTDKIKKGDFKVPALKPVKNDKAKALVEAFNNTADDEDVPF